MEEEGTAGPLPQMDAIDLEIEGLPRQRDGIDLKIAGRPQQLGGIHLVFVGHQRQLSEGCQRNVGLQHQAELANLDSVKRILDIGEQ
jgi:hypothetical protein